ncbi:YesK family protein [Peribacillus sp. NPDC097675]|uniref:YesK family protein n=1 Tax=Peribacillus sp. NPDC097675 TaxID=3390618 RepID=UPI003D013F87
MTFILLVTFVIALIRNKKMITTACPLTFILLGIIYLLSGLLIVGGFEGMAVSIYGFIFLVRGAITQLINSLFISYRAKDTHKF